MYDNAGPIDSVPGAEPPGRGDLPIGMIDEVRSCAEVLADARRWVEPAYRRVIADVPDRLRHVISYHAGWWDAQGEPSQSSGKGIRTALTLLSAAATADGAASAAARQATMAALAVEMVHGSTGRPRYSDLRHHKKTLPMVAALNSGTAAGDELARWYALDTEPTGGELADAATLIERAGARRWAQDVSAEISAEAVRTLESACPRWTASAELGALLTTGGDSDRG